MGAFETISSLGFGFRERMSGEWTKGPFSFEFDVRCDDLPAGILDVVGAMEGRVTAEGLATDAPARGVIAISPLWKRRIRYTFGFEGTDGRRYEFDGQKTLRPLSPITSWTTLRGKIRDEATREVVGEAELRFDLASELVAFLTSFRPIRREWSTE
jgi:hypothetical protein